MNMLKENMRLIAECSQKLVRLGENLWGKEQKLDKQMQEHQKLCDEIMDIQEIEPIEAEMEQIIHCPEGYIFKDENGNVINATKIVLEKKKKEYPKTYEECCEVLQYGESLKIYPPSNADVPEYDALGLFDLLETLRKLLICRDAYWKIAGDWKPDWRDMPPKHVLNDDNGTIVKNQFWYGKQILSFPTEEMRDAFYENFKELIEQCKELL